MKLDRNRESSLQILRLEFPKGMIKRFVDYRADENSEITHGGIKWD